MLQAKDDLYVVVDRGEPPVTHDRRAVPWEAVESVDHSALAMRLAQPASELDRAPELDPGRPSSRRSASRLPAPMRYG